RIINQISMAMQRIMRGDNIAKPVVQILGFKSTPTRSDQERFRLLISDGKHFNSNVIITNELSKMYKGRFSDNTIIRLDKYSIREIQSSIRVIIVTELAVLHPGGEGSSKIGDPASYSQPGTSTASNVAMEQLQIQENNCNSNENVMGLKMASITTIANLMPYNTKWIIKAYVKWKSPINPYANGQGKQFRMILKDNSGEIQATAFTKECDKFYNILKVDKTYIISNGNIKVVNKHYKARTKNDYELLFNYRTEVKICNYAEIKHALVPISQVINMQIDASANTIGICRHVGALQNFTSKANKAHKIRDLILFDQSCENVSVRLWNDKAVNFSGQVNSVIMIAESQVYNHLGKIKLNVGYATSLITDPDIKEAHNLRDWFNNGGAANMLPLSFDSEKNVNNDWITLKDAISHDSGGKSDYFQCRSIITLFTNSSIVYKSCAKCTRKVSEEGNGIYRCEKCGIFSNFDYCFRLKMQIMDSTAGAWVICFNKVGEELLKHSAREIAEALETDSTATDRIFEDIKYLPFLFTMQRSSKIYNGELLNQLIVKSISPIDQNVYNRRLINEVRNMTAIEVA
ncbi:hypothetical protein KR093_002560, partial [Drosophila rubida]